MFGAFARGWLEEQGFVVEELREVPLEEFRGGNAKADLVLLLKERYG